MQRVVTVVGAAAVWDYIFNVEKLPQTGDIVKLQSDCEDPFPGGCAPNIAVGIARLCGCMPQLYYPVGKEFASSGLREQWSSKGVDCASLTVVNDARSGCSWMYMQPSGATMCFAYAGAADIATAELVGVLGEWVVIAPVLNRFTQTILEEAIAEKKKIVFTGICAEEVIPFLPAAHSVIINAHEAKILANSLSLDSITALTEHFPNTVLYVTNGKHGSTVFDHGTITAIPLIPDEGVIDFTGAGDAYTSGVISGMIRGLSPTNAAYVGSTNSSFVVECFGGQTNLPSWEKLKERLSAYVPKVGCNLI